MSKKTTGADFNNALKSVLDDYGIKVTTSVNNYVSKKGKELAKAINKEAPKGATKKHSKSWTSTNKLLGTETQAVVHSKDYQLAHLLENGHLLNNAITRDGTTRRGDVPTKAFHYIEKATDETLRDFIDGMADAIQEGK